MRIEARGQQDRPVDLERRGQSSRAQTATPVPAEMPTRWTGRPGYGHHVLLDVAGQIGGLAAVFVYVPLVVEDLAARTSRRSRWPGPRRRRPGRCGSAGIRPSCRRRRRSGRPPGPGRTARGSCSCSWRSRWRLSAARTAAAPWLPPRASSGPPVRPPPAAAEPAAAGSLAPVRIGAMNSRRTGCGPGHVSAPVPWPSRLGVHWTWRTLAYSARSPSVWSLGIAKPTRPALMLCSRSIVPKTAVPAPIRPRSACEYMTYMPAPDAVQRRGQVVVRRQGRRQQDRPVHLHSLGQGLQCPHHDGRAAAVADERHGPARLRRHVRGHHAGQVLGRLAVALSSTRSPTHRPAGPLDQS